MHSRIIKNDEREKWDEFVMRAPNAIAWHLFEWSDLVKKHYETEFFPLVVEEKEEILGVLPLFKIKPLKGSPRMISVPHAVAGGMLSDDPRARKILLQAALEKGEENGVKNLTLKQYKVKVEGDLSSDENYFNRELSLEGGPDEVWERITQENRDAILSTGKVPMELEYPAEDLDSFYRFLLEYHRRKGIPCVSRKWIRDLVDLGMYSAAVMKKSGRILGATMVKEFKDTISFPFSCSSGDSPEDLGHVYRLYWELMKKYSEKGFKICHSGRIPRTEDVDPFRLGWGGTKFPYYYQYYPPTVHGTEFSRKRGWKRSLFTAAWKMMPAPVSGFLGPYVVRQFP